MMSDFARFDFANEFRVNEIERAGFGGENVGAVEFAERRAGESQTDRAPR